MMGAQVETDWRVSSPITWTGEYNGKAYEDKGEILEYVPGRRLAMTHFSPMSGAADEPANYHRVVYELDDLLNRTHVTLTQDGNASEGGRALGRELDDDARGTEEGGREGLTGQVSTEEAHAPD